VVRIGHSWIRDGAGRNPPNGVLPRQTVPVRSYRFYGLSHEAAGSLASALSEDGMTAERFAPGIHELTGWVVVANGEDRSEGLLEMLAQIYGGSYEGEDLAGA